MADNVQITPGSGVTVAADDVGGGKEVQLIKPGWGPHGNYSYTDKPTGFPVQLHLPTSQQLTWAPVSFSSSGDNTLVAGTSAQTIRVFVLYLTAELQIRMTFKDSTPNNFSGAMQMTAVDWDFIGEPYFVTASGKDFQVNLSGAAQVSGLIAYQKS